MFSAQIDPIVPLEREKLTLIYCVDQGIFSNDVLDKDVGRVVVDGDYIIHDLASIVC